MSADKLGGRIDYDINTVLDWPEDIGTHRIVENKRQTVGMSNGRNGLQVCNIQLWIADTFTIDGLGLRGNRCLQVFGVG